MIVVLTLLPCIFFSVAPGAIKLVTAETNKYTYNKRSTVEVHNKLERMHPVCRYVHLTDRLNPLATDFPSDLNEM